MKSKLFVGIRGGIYYLRRGKRIYMKRNSIQEILHHPPVHFAAPDKVSASRETRLRLFAELAGNPDKVCPLMSNRFGSLSQNGLVYKLDNHHHRYIVKTTPMTTASENENGFVEIFSNMARQGINEHFPMCYRSLLCQNVNYTNNISLYRKYFEDMHAKNHPAIQEFLANQTNNITDDRRHIYNRLLRNGKLSQAWKMLSVDIHDLGPEFYSRVFIIEMAEQDLRMFLRQHVGTRDIMKQICETLEFVYRLGYHHNDVHPGNILLMDSFVLLWDFEKMQSRNTKEELRDLQYLCSSFTNSNRWEPTVISFIDRILDGELKTWEDVRNSI